MILIISTCKEKLHEPEFVKPIEKIIKENNLKFKTIHYSKLTPKIIASSNKIIITGTSIQDNEFLSHLRSFEFIKECRKPVLGICAGMQVISLLFGAKIKKKTEIGFYRENFKKEFLGLKGKPKVYHLHNNYTTLPGGFELYTKSKIPQAIKHKQKEIYGVLFHPEVRNAKLIENFINS